MGLSFLTFLLQLLSRSDGNRPLRTTVTRWEESNKTDLKNRYEDVNWLLVLRKGPICLRLGIWYLNKYWSSGSRRRVVSKNLLTSEEHVYSSFRKARQSRVFRNVLNFYQPKRHHTLETGIYHTVMWN